MRTLELSRGSAASRVLVCTAGAGLLAGSRVDANGVPVKSYVKDLISVGTWRDPRTGENFEVTPADLDRWTKTFSRMKDAGVRVPVPEGHTDESSSVRGFCEGMFTDGKTLFGNIDLYGEKAIEMASTAEVSIYAPAKFIDGKGNEYDQPIMHVALTPAPVISGQGGFVPIKASRGGTEQVPVFRLAQETTMNPQLLAVAKALGVDCSNCKTDQDLHDAIMAKNKGATDTAVAMSRELDQSKKDLALAQGELQTLKRSDQPRDPMLLKLSRQNRELVLDRFADTPLKAFVKAQKARWCPSDDKVLSLSLTPAADAMFEGLVEDLKLIDLPALREQTGGTRSLSRSMPADSDDAKNDGKEDPKVVDRVLSYLGRKREASK